MSKGLGKWERLILKIVGDDPAWCPVHKVKMQRVEDVVRAQYPILESNRGMAAYKDFFEATLKNMARGNEWGHELEDRTVCHGWQDFDPEYWAYRTLVDEGYDMSIRFERRPAEYKAWIDWQKRAKIYLKRIGSRIEALRRALRSLDQKGLIYRQKGYGWTTGGDGRETRIQYQIVKCCQGQTKTTLKDEDD